MRRLLSSFRPDVVSAHKLYPQLSVSPLVVASRAGVPVVQTVHDYEFVSASPYDARGGWLDRDESALRFRLLNTGLFATKMLVHRRVVNRWVAVSSFVAAKLAAQGIEATVLVNPAPALADECPALEARSGILFVGTLSRQKGVHHAVRLAARLPHITVTIVGDGPLRPQVSRARGSAPNLRVTGAVDRPTVLRFLSGRRRGRGAVAVGGTWCARSA